MRYGKSLKSGLQLMNIWARVAALEDKVKTLEDAIDDMSQMSDDFNTRLSSVEQAVVALINKIADLKNQAANALTPDEAAAINARLDALVNNINGALASA